MMSLVSVSWSWFHRWLWLIWLPASSEVFSSATAASLHVSYKDNMLHFLLVLEHVAYKGYINDLLWHSVGSRTATSPWPCQTTLKAPPHLNICSIQLSLMTLIINPQRAGHREQRAPWWTHALKQWWCCITSWMFGSLLKNVFNRGSYIRPFSPWCGFSSKKPVHSLFPTMHLNLPFKSLVLIFSLCNSIFFFFG